MNLRLWLISLNLVLAGCSLGVTKPDVVVHTTKGHIPIECGLEPAVDKVKMRPVKTPRIVDVSGGKWVAISLPAYANLSKNVADMVTSYEQRLAQVNWYRGCISTFNARSEP